MKTIRIMTVVLTMILVSSTILDAQKIMKLNNDLKASSQPIEAKRKGMSSVGKYEFGPYRIVSGKGGWGTTTSNKKMFSFKTKSESKSKSSFVFTINDKDTINVNTATNTKFTETEVGNFGFLNNSVDNYSAIIAPEYDTTLWKMVVTFNMGEDVNGNFNASGALTDGKTNIQIREVRVWEDGKTPMMKAICGYEFYLENTAIAAVQSCMDATKKKLVWLNQNLDQPTKDILAAASAALMVHTDSQGAQMN
jgi:hypothetical protein